MFAAISSQRASGNDTSLRRLPALDDPEAARSWIARLRHAEPAAIAAPRALRASVLTALPQPAPQLPATFVQSTVSQPALEISQPTKVGAVLVERTRWNAVKSRLRQCKPTKSSGWNAAFYMFAGATLGSVPPAIADGHLLSAYTVGTIIGLGFTALTWFARRDVVHAESASIDSIVSEMDEIDRFQDSGNG